MYICIYLKQTKSISSNISKFSKYKIQENLWLYEIDHVLQKVKT